MTDAPLRQLGKYELTDILGQGAMGIVYRARDPVLNRFLAIKIMSSLIAGDEQLRDRFLREAQAAGSLQHPNVVTVYDFGEAEGHLFIAMEYVEGVDLEELIARRDALPVEAKLDIMIDALSGLAYAHSHGLVHRDIKPANIRVATDRRAKLMDFGIARMGSANLTQTGSLLGTPQYMAPEQVTGAEITAATDIFAAGCVLYELLTYEKAFTGDSLHVILYRIVSEEPVPLLRVVPTLPHSLEAIVTQAMAKDPSKRFRSALDMCQALTKCRDALTGTTRRSTVSIRGSSRTLALKRPADTRQRNRVLAGGGVALAAGLALWAWSPWRASATGVAAPSSVPGASAPQAAASAPPAVTASGSGASPPAATPPATPTSSAPRAPSPGARPSTAAAVPGTNASMDSMVLAVRTNVLGNRRAAQEAGASTSDLAAGDSLLAAADALIARKQSADAVQRLSLASVRWVETERRLRDRTAHDRQAPEPERKSAAAPPPAATVPPAAPAVERLPSPPPAATEVDARPEIERVIAAYAHAIESGSVAEIRRAYPGITAAQQQQWEGFYRTVRNFKARLAIDQLSISGSTADARVSANYSYENRGNGQTDRQTFTLQAVVAREGGSWRLSAIR